MPKIRSRDSSISSQGSIHEVTSRYETPEQAVSDNIEKIDLEPKRITAEHPLGKLLLNIATQSNEIARKNNCFANTLDLNDLCNDFNSSIQLERNSLKDKFDNQNQDFLTLAPKIEQSILTKEINYAQANQSIQAPEFSTLPSTGQITEAAKIFPIKKKFSGSNQNILEFLNEINFCQQNIKLNETEFLDLFLRCFTNNAYTVVSEYIQLGYKTQDIYLSLLQMFDNRIAPAEARRELAQYTAKKNSNIIAVQNKIMYLASRIASELPTGLTRNSMYDLESTRGLIRAVPTQSSQLISNSYNLLASKIQGAPNFVQLTKYILPYHDSINQDIKANGTNFTSFLNRRTPMRQVTHGSKIYAINMQNGYPEQKNRNNYRVNPNSGYNPLNRIDRVRTNNYQSNSRHNLTPNTSFRRKYCTLCGSSTHTSDQICYRMRTADNKIVEVIPTYAPCQECKRILGKELHHPSKFCISRPDYPKQDIQKRKN